MTRHYERGRKGEVSFCTATKTVKTKKPHRCIFCERVIPQGEKAITWGWVDDGKMERLYACQPCEWWTDNGRDDETEINPGERMEDFYADCPVCGRNNMVGWTDGGTSLEIECDSCGQTFKRPFGWDYEEYGCDGEWQIGDTP